MRIICLSARPTYKVSTPIHLHPAQKQAFHAHKRLSKHPPPLHPHFPRPTPGHRSMPPTHELPTPRTSRSPSAQQPQHPPPAPPPTGSTSRPRSPAVRTKIAASGGAKYAAGSTKGRGIEKKMRGLGKAWICLG